MNTGAGLCPVCGHSAEDMPELEAHVNSHFVAGANSQPGDSDTTEGGGATAAAAVANGDLEQPSGADFECFQFCPMCYLEIEDVADLENHVNIHLSEDENSPVAEEGKVLVVEQQEAKAKREPRAGSSKAGGNPCGIHPSWKDSLESCSPGVLGRLRSFHAGNCRSTLVLCNDCSHFSTQGMPDRSFGCGYRNLQMMLSCLVNNPLYLERIFQGIAFVPSVYRLQGLLEDAWKAGFDRTGAEQLNHRVVRTRKWIGATEVATFFSYLKVRCQIYDFTKKAYGSVGHPKLEACVRGYFKSENVWKSPLYFQHQGHSRVIVGFEECGRNFRLVVLDPGMPKHELERMLRNMTQGGGGGGQRKISTSFLPEEISMPLSSFKSSQYQIVAVLGLMKDEAEVQHSKVLTSIQMS